MEKAIKTTSGFECKIDEEAADDIRLYELIIKHDSGNRMDQIAVIPGILDLFMGEAQREALYAYLIEKEGRPKISTLEADINGLFKSLSSSKKK